MIAPVIFTTTTTSESLRLRHERKETLGHLPEAEFIRIMLDAFDVVRVEEVRRDTLDTYAPLCKVSYALEELTKEDDQWLSREVQHVVVRHSLEEISQIMAEAKREKPDWEP